jgi:hypothetical protein
MKTYWGVEIQLHAFLPSALDGGEWSASGTGCFTPRERAPGTHWIGGSVGPRAGLDAVSKRKVLSPQPRFEPRPSNCPARSQSLYRLSYPGSSWKAIDMPVVNLTKNTSLSFSKVQRNVILHHLNTYSLTHSMMQEILWNADSHSADQTITCFLCGT